MAKISDIIRRLLPIGTAGTSEGGWDECPAWPPDVFAVAATFAEISGCYSAAAYSGGSAGGLFGPDYRRRVRSAGKKWRESVFPPPSRARQLWRELLSHGDREIGEGGIGARRWRNAAMELLAIADEASAGIGFIGEARRTPFSTAVVAAHYEFVRSSGRRSLLIPNPMVSLCARVPVTEACVHPKTRTAQVGCTLRSLSHHLSLLPPIGTVECRWHLYDVHPAGDLRLLIVPYPYRIDEDAFVAGTVIQDDRSRSRHFRLRQTWLPGGGSDSQARAIARFLRELVGQVPREEGPVHGIVLPEAALPDRVARLVARELAGVPRLEMFVTGVIADERRAGGLPSNRAYTSLFHEGQLFEWYQSKHHRWRLEGGQVQRYGLGRLDGPARFWWEEIDITRRKMNFTIFRPGASVAVLVCEDLARHDPVQPAVQAIGPSLVIALLLDGPQVMARWPGQYATVLSDDPGSSVLTVTSLGMVRRSVRPDAGRPMPVALWKQPWRELGGDAKELALTQGGHALLLKLDTVSEQNWTLDGRSDHGNTIGLGYVGVREVRHRSPPNWI